MIYVQICTNTYKVDAKMVQLCTFGYLFVGTFTRDCLPLEGRNNVGEMTVLFAILPQHILVILFGISSTQFPMHNTKLDKIN